MIVSAQKSEGRDSNDKGSTISQRNFEISGRQCSSKYQQRSFWAEVSVGLGIRSFSAANDNSARLPGKFPDAFALSLIDLPQGELDFSSWLKDQ